MNEKYCYEKSIEGLKKYIKQYGKLPSIPNWNKYAKENDYLSTESMKYISGLKFDKLVRTISTN